MDQEIESLAPAVTRAALILDLLAASGVQPIGPSGMGRRLAELGGAHLATVDQVQEFYDAFRRLPTGSDPPILLGGGDEVVVETERIGRLVNTCRFDHAAAS